MSETKYAIRQVRGGQILIVPRPGEDDGHAWAPAFLRPLLASHPDVDDFTADHSWPAGEVEKTCEAVDSTGTAHGVPARWAVSARCRKHGVRVHYGCDEHRQMTRDGDMLCNVCEIPVSATWAELIGAES